ncbi:FtsW/RodA/SpoVE family cell cycle protein [Hoyosella rhizosphaerae]|uniref:Penicillin-binding protein transpeptidase domain-containing protein n=1 Tax=Hoyosella rhizosphaerae TaxID=1755582 RepID=A0A916U0V5_9ACTN|nr:FtsW/RodA/SpoVE family cell cycle protein [Hoyosella rhizosphaerae]MBN4927095.1 FtsW/RodA/SpoVE family cell cycle protein [Hoyosella rhizosphaerae]GGC54080.1 hypothetical protein GCM10011410_03010 [Hoyosella rhizosphaerae]
MSAPAQPQPWVWHRSPILAMTEREWRTGLSVSAACFLLMLTALGRLTWPVGTGLLLTATAAVMPLLLALAVRKFIGSKVSLAVPWAAWFLTCLGYVTGLRLEPSGAPTTAMWIVLALVTFLVAARFASRWHPRVSQTHAFVIAAVGLALMALPLVPPLQHAVGDVRAWVRIGPITAQPVELARPFIVISVAILALATVATFRQATPRTIAITASPLAAAAILALLLDDLGPLLAIVGGGIVIITLCLPKMRYALFMFGGIAALGALLFLVSAKVRDRFTELMEPVLPDGRIRQSGMGQMALSRGGWFGSGFDRGTPGVIPVVESDYILAGIGEERGYATLLVIVALYTIIAVGGWYSALRARSLAMRLITAGLTAMLSIQTAYVILGNLGVVPMTGMVTPFLSKGGSAMIGMWFTIGLICGAGARSISLNAPRSERELTQRIALVTPGIPLLWVLIVGGAVMATAIIDPTPASSHASSVPLTSRSDLVTRDGNLLASTVTNANEFPSRPIHTVPGFDDDNYQLITTIDERVQHWPNCGSWWRNFFDLECPPQPAVSSLSPTIQTAARDALAGLVGDVVVLDTTTSSVLAAWSTPDSGNSQRWANGHPALVADTAPGSTFKIVTAAAALSAGLSGDTELSSEYTPPGGQGVVRNHDRGSSGGSLENALAVSSNTAFAQIAIELGEDELKDMSSAMSTWENGDMVLPNRPITLGDVDGPDALARTGFGQQDVRATPATMAHIAAIIANNGAATPPRTIIGSCRKGRFSPSEMPRPTQLISPAAAERIRDGMELSITQGQVPALTGLAEGIAAKTGTAENSAGLYDGWIIAIAPAEHTTIAVAVRVVADTASGVSRGGATNAGPVAAAVLRTALSESEISPEPCA